MAHRIRLRQPWTESVDTVPHDGEDETCLIHQITYSRRFNRPTGLTEADSIEIELVDQLGEIRSVELNQHLLDGDSSAGGQRVAINGAIEDHNELRIVLRHLGNAPSLGQVNLWITSPEG